MIGSRRLFMSADGPSLRSWAIAALACVALLVCVVPALAHPEGGYTWGGNPDDCEACHQEQSEEFFDTRQGPHGNYTTSSSKCIVCHEVHTASSSFMLLPAETIKGTCLTCHDGTGGLGVYGAIEARNLSVGASHRIDTTNTVPGGDAATGGSAVVNFGGECGCLTCGDCHNPHDANTVDPFRGERIRYHVDELSYGAPDKEWRTSKLLRQLPTGATTATTVYGSDWCAGCHKGRPSGGSVMNHPVDSTATTTSPFYYDWVAIVTTETSLETTMGTMGLLGSETPTLMWHNRGFVMPSPRTTEQAGHFPICQQCHEDARLVGEPGAVERAEVYRWGDGRTVGDPEDSDPASDTPLFQTFPHEGQNSCFTVETGDTLCLNCHDIS